MKVQTLSHSFALLNVKLSCDDVSLISLHELLSYLQDIYKFINDVPFDDILIIGDLNTDPFK